MSRQVLDGQEQLHNVAAPSRGRNRIDADYVTDGGRRLVSQYTCEASTLEASWQQGNQVNALARERGDVVFGDDWRIGELPDGLRFVATIITRPIIDQQSINECVSVRQDVMIVAVRWVRRVTSAHGR